MNTTNDNKFAEKVAQYEACLKRLEKSGAEQVEVRNEPGEPIIYGIVDFECEIDGMDDDVFLGMDFSDWNVRPYWG